AVQHAHQKGIIHRDLKPSNVLVTMYDDRPVPKVIDFGVAKAVEQRLTERTLFTQYGALVGTFEYMSPEQAEMNAFGVDTRSDIYALGVLLYELLTGTTPLDRKRLREAALDELVRLIKEEEPPRPSVRLSSSDTLAKVAAARKTEPARLSQLVRGEIDWIVMKCLEKDRSRRYETASGLARDVERYLHDEPVEACPPSAGYRLRKFVRRNRAAVSTAGAAMILIFLTIVGITLGLVEARRQRDIADRARAEALEQRSDAAAAATTAQSERDKAETARQDLRRSLYASDLQLAQAAWERNNVPRVLDLLKRHSPGPGEADLRGFEWHYWNRLCRTELRTVKLPGGMIWGKLSPDGTRYVASWTRGANGASPRREVELRIFDATTGKELSAFTPIPGASLRGFSFPGFSPDGKGIVFAAQVQGPSGGEDWRLLVLDRDTGRAVFTLATLPGSPHIAFDRAGGRLAVAVTPPGSQADGKLTIWDVGGGKPLLTIPLSDGRVGQDRALTFSPDGTRLAALLWTPGTVDLTAAGEVRIWETDSGKELLRFPSGPGARGGQLAYSPDGKYLAELGAVDTALKLRDPASGQVLVELPRPGSFSFSPDGAWLANLSDDDDVQLWDLAAGGAEAGRAPARVLQGLDRIRSVAFSADGRLVSAVGSDGTIKTWEVSVREPRVVVRQPGARLTATAAAADPARFAAAWKPADGTTTIKVWDATGKVLFAATDAAAPNLSISMPRDLTFSPDGTRLAYSAYDNTHTAGKRSIASRLRVWDVASGKELFRRDSDRGTFPVPAFSPDGRRLATSHRTTQDPTEAPTSRLSVWDLAADKEVLGLDVPGFALGIAFSPDGRRLAGGLLADATGSRECELRVWDAAMGTVVLSRKGYRGWIGQPAFSADGRRLAVAVAESVAASAIHVLDAADGRELSEPLKGHRGRVRELAFSPDGRRLASSEWFRGSALKLWDVAAGRELLTLPNQGGGSFAFSPDGRWLYWVGGPSEGSDAEVQVWDATPLPDDKLRDR
ncbi:MAG: WD40 repeat domain-containing serine/threonine-protein kinase, partial [Gemmataceae bacterium]|nr:WD40 repeat domain-containing serine/threonine-protein kinase [Gemmataceae bacterium]